ncbi:hypothetical protein QBE52_01845 [Clostridiaceae bacterium 35-E11]
MKKIASFVLIFAMMFAVMAVPSYAEKSFVPPGLAKKGGLPPGIAKKLVDMKGYEGLKTDEIVRLLEKLDWKDIEEEGKVKIISDFEGVVESIQNETVKVRVGDLLVMFQVDRDLSNIEIGDRIRVTLDGNNQVKRISIIGEEDEQSVYAKLLIINEDEIAVKVNENFKVYELTDDVKVYIHDQREALEDLKENTMVYLTLEENKVTTIRWKPVVGVSDWTFEGTLDTIDRDDKEITVKNNTTKKRFEINNDTDIRIDGDDERFTDLEIGMKVEVTVEDGEVVKVVAENRDDHYEGKLVKVAFGSPNQLTIRRNNQDQTFVVDEDVEVEIDDDEEDFEDLREEIGSDIEIEVVNNKIVAIEVED